MLAYLYKQKLVLFENDETLKKLTLAAFKLSFDIPI